MSDMVSMRRRIINAKLDLQELCDHLCVMYSRECHGGGGITVGDMESFDAARNEALESLRGLEEALDYVPPEEETA